jgi:CheY-like chemotaxis protein
MGAQPTPITSKPIRDSVIAARCSCSVLVIDDEVDTRDLLCVILEHAGYSVASAIDGRDALATLHSMKPELILLDIQMPIMDGAEFRQAQRRDQALMRIPTVVMTGSKEEPVLDMGVVECLHKPFRTKDLLAIISRYCSPPTSG